MTSRRSAIDQIEFMRNLLAFVLVGAFVVMGGALFVFAIPEANKEILIYMVGQLSGMALTALGFYFVNKVGQDALDAQRAANTGKLADVAKSALQTNAGDPDAAAAEGAQAATDAAQETTNEIKDKGK